MELLTEYAPVAPAGFEEALDAALALATDATMFRRFGELAADDDDDNDDDDREDEE